MESKKRQMVIFYISYNPAIIEEICNFMNEADFDIESIQYPHLEKISYKTTTKVDARYIKKIKKAIQKAYESLGCKVFTIEYDK